MNFFKTIINGLSDKIAKQLINKMYLSLVPIGTLIMHYLEDLQIFLSNHIVFVTFLLLSSWAISFHFFRENSKMRKEKIEANRKTLINEIYVNRVGTCFCPHCETLLTLMKNPKRLYEKIFTCVKCDKVVSPIMENGQPFCAGRFYAFQKSNPLTDFNLDEFLKNRRVIL